MKYSELSGKMFDIPKICEIEYLIFGVNWDKNGHKFSCSTQPEIANGFPPIEIGAFVILQFSNFFVKICCCIINITSKNCDRQL